MAIHTKLCSILNIKHPIILAPMAGVSGGRLAAAVTRAGGLGLIGGGYGDADWLRREVLAAGNAKVGMGFISWSLARQPELLDIALDRSPAALMLSFGDFRPFIEKIRRSAAKLIVQVQSVAQAREAVAQEVDIIVAQGTEAGGHGGSRATLPLVPAIADIAGQIPVVAAGGIGDGRGLAAALTLGASGVLCGTAFFASEEALSHDNAKQAVIAGSGDDTLRSSVFDIARGLDWPADWKLRTMRNAFSQRWHDDAEDLIRNIHGEKLRFEAAREEGNMEIAPVIAGEAIDLIHGRAPAEAIIARMIDEAETSLRRANDMILI